jgi:hypothetical protein
LLLSRLSFWLVRWFRPTLLLGIITVIIITIARFLSDSQKRPGHRAGSFAARRELAVGQFESTIVEWPTI